MITLSHHYLHPSSNKIGSSGADALRTTELKEMLFLAPAHSLSSSPHLRKEGRKERRKDGRKGERKRGEGKLFPLCSP